jgi:hypothetical protein
MVVFHGQVWFGFFFFFGKLRHKVLRILIACLLPLGTAYQGELLQALNKIVLVHRILTPYILNFAWFFFPVARVWLLLAIDATCVDEPPPSMSRCMSNPYVTLL